MEVEEAVTWYHLPEDVVNLIFHVLMNENPSLYYVNMILINKASMRLLSRINLDWLAIFEAIKNSLPWSCRPDTPHPNSNVSTGPVGVGLMRAVCYNHQRLPFIRKEIDDYIEENKIIYKSKKGNLYKGYVSPKTLAKLPGQSYTFYRLIKRYRVSEIARKKHATRLKVLFDRTKWDNHFRKPILLIK